MRARAGRWGGALVFAIALLVAAPGRAQTPAGENAKPGDVSDLVNALLGGLMGAREVTGESLQAEVAEAGGIPFKRDVPLAFIGHDQLARYLHELIDSEYPTGRARSDERLLQAFDLLQRGTDLRKLRSRLLEENVAGFYDERPDKRRLYAVSEDRSFSPMNQIVLAHELRHALQDQYRDLYSYLGDDVTDFDDRRVAWMSLLEGDATLVMERFVKLRLGFSGDAIEGGGLDNAALGSPSLYDLPDAPPVVRDALMQPYLAGLALCRAIWARGGAAAIRDAWANPPESTEQVLHPERFFAREAPRRVSPSIKPPTGAWLLSEGTLGELLLRSLLEPGAESAAEGWGGDGWRLYDAGSRTLLLWRSEWDTPADAREFQTALRARFERHATREPARDGFELFRNADGFLFAVRGGSDWVELVSGDDPSVVTRVLAGAGQR